jgi:hypothetical protein
MKYVLLAIFVLFSAQPIQAAPCDMQGGQDSSDSPHHAMTDSSMHDDGQAMDCCDDEPNGSGESCGSMSHCGASPAGFFIISSSSLSTPFNTGAHQFPLPENAPLNGFSSPPFRPPIS